MARKRKHSRRAKGTGSVFFHEGRGVWVGRKPVGTLPSGRTKYLERCGKTQAECVAKLNAAVPPGPDITLAAWADRWLAGQGTRAGTRRAYGCDVRHIKLHLGSVRLRDLTPTRVEQFASQLAGSLGVNTVRKTLAALRNMLGGAVRDGVLASNPVSVARKPKAAKKKIDPFTSEELSRIVAACVTPATRPIALLATTGIRVGEAMALDVGHYDPTTGLLSIVATFDRNNGMGEPKSANGVRTIRVPEAGRVAVLAAIGKRKVGPLFPTAKNNRGIADLTRTAWKRLLARLGLRFRNLHQLRHTVGSHMMAASFSPADVAKYLGDGPDTIIRYYCHATGQDPSKAMDTLFQSGRSMSSGTT